MHQLAVCAQIIIALSVVFVWVFRFTNIVNEFHEYHLSDLTRNAVGATKIAVSALLIAGIWYPGLVLGSALLMALLMLCAQIAHIKARHPWQKFMPSLALLLLSLFVCAVYSGKIPA